MTSEQMSTELTEARREITALTEKMKAAFKRLDEQKEMAGSIHALAISVERQTAELKQQHRDIEHLRSDMDIVKARPAKRWDVLISGIISAFIAAAMTMLTKNFRGGI